MTARSRWIYVLLALCLLLAACTPSGGVATTPAPVATQPDGLATSAPTAPAAATATPAADTAAPAWALALRAALEACAGVGRDQICYAQGSISLTLAEGAEAGALAQPGDMVDLANVTGLSLGGGEAWGLVVLGLSAGIDAPGQVTTLVVMGPIEITGLTTNVSDDAFAWALAQAVDTEARTSADGQPASVELAELPALTEVEPLQSLSFTSDAASGDAPSGLLLMSPWAGDMATVQINGAAIALGSTAFIQADSGGPLTVAMFEGGALVTAGETSVAVPPGAQASLPQNSGGVAPNPAPEINILDPRAEAIANAVDQYGLPEIDPRAEAIANAVDNYGEAIDPRAEAIAAAVDQYGLYVARYYAQKYRRAINKCTDPANPQARYVYNVMYWDTLLTAAVDASDLAAALGPNGLAELEAGAERCLRFEIDFDSTADFTSDDLQYGIEVKAEGLPVQLFANGLMVERIQGQVTHPRYEVHGEESIPCGRELITTDGTLTLNIVFVRIKGNTLGVMVDFWPDVPAEYVNYTCPNGSNPTAALAWSPLFFYSHQKELAAQSYRFYDWRVYQGEHFAEVIYEEVLDLSPGTAHVTTYMVLVHTPDTSVAGQ